MTKNGVFEKKVTIKGTLVFQTAFHIGSGREGELATDMGVLRELDGRPILPGSTLKGSFRSLVERLSVYLGQDACLLDSQLSNVNCVSDERYRKKVYNDFKKLDQEDLKLQWLEKHTCPLCALFGSPLQASRIFFSDAALLQWSRSVQIRDGVCIDRDSETARDRAKYDFEVVPEGAVFSVVIEVENPAEEELALIAAGLKEWENGFRLGGFTSRGLGKVRLHDTEVKQVDYTDIDQLKAYLVSGAMSDAGDLLKNCLEQALAEGKGGENA
jgi:CRISPR-associated RAMP protein (TIGR02581 family)